MSGTEQLPTRLIEDLDVHIDKVKKLADQNEFVQNRSDVTKREAEGEWLSNLAGDMIGQGVPKKANNDRAVSRNTDPCVACGGDDDDGLVLLCDECNHAYHDFCAGFREKLQGDWLCPSCKKH